MKSREEHVRQKKTQWEKMNKILKAKKRPSLTLAKHLQIERKTWREKKKLKMERQRLQVKQAALDGARNVLSYVKESDCEMREIVSRMKEKVEEDYRRLQEVVNENSY